MKLLIRFQKGSTILQSLYMQNILLWSPILSKPLYSLWRLWCAYYAYYVKMSYLLWQEGQANNQHISKTLPYANITKWLSPCSVLVDHIQDKVVAIIVILECRAQANKTTASKEHKVLNSSSMNASMIPPDTTEDNFTEILICFTCLLLDEEQLPTRTGMEKYNHQ